MNHEYDLFEKFPDGSSLWRASVVGLGGARLHMFDLSRRSTNVFYAMNVINGKIVTFNAPPAAFQLGPKVGRRSKSAAA